MVIVWKRCVTLLRHPTYTLCDDASNEQTSPALFFREEAPQSQFFGLDHRSGHFRQLNENGSLLRRGKARRAPEFKCFFYKWLLELIHDMETSITLSLYIVQIFVTYVGWAITHHL